jgi:putative transposase
LGCERAVRFRSGISWAAVPAGTWFFTVNLLERRETLLVDCIYLLRDSVARTRLKYPFEIDAFVVLSDHIHTLWTLPSMIQTSQSVGA